MIGKSNSPHQGKKAQAMVEFALALPVFLLMVLGVIEFGHLLAVVASIYTAAREGARYGSASGYYTDCNGIIAAANGVGLLARPITVAIGYDDADSSTNVGDPGSYAASHKCGGFTIDSKSAAIPRIIVKVSTQFSFYIIPLPSIPITSQSARTIISDVQYTELPSSVIGVRTATATATATLNLTPTPISTATSTLTPTGTITPVVVPTHVPYCQFLRADPGILTNNTTPQRYTFYIRNSSASINAKITRIKVGWGGALNPEHSISLTEIDYQEFQKILNVVNPPDSSYDSGTLSGGPIVSPSTTTTPPPPDFRLYFSAAKKDSVTISYATLNLTYQDPGTGDTVNCSLNPGQEATKIP